MRISSSQRVSTEIFTAIELAGESKIDRPNSRVKVSLLQSMTLRALRESG